MIFQDPLSSLNPIVKVGKQITEATLINSNKLKKMYERIISDELIAYKNVITKRDVKIKHVEDQLYTFKQTKLKALTKDTPAEEKAKVKAEIKKLKEESKVEIAKIKEEAKLQSVPLKEALEAKKVVAKAEVQKYKDSVEAKYQEAVNEAQTKFANDPKALKEELKKLKSEKVNSLKITKAEAKRRALEIMKEVGIPLPEKRFNQYPFEFSGGMRQRIVILLLYLLTQMY